ncbi:MAG: WbqC family protein [Prolixibacteraceae bacterium]|jgi:hypothetical protein|nr:WbqC family protein [Prolixibacteraceae bacterium]
MVLLSTAYFPNIEYCSTLISNQTIFIEQHEHFIKQTYRNRAIILVANGPVPLIVPVMKGRGPKTKICDLKISYDEAWQRNQWRTLFSAYNSSPFFEFYADDIEPFFRKKYTFLFDLNMDILNILTNLLEVRPEIVLTENFEQIPGNCLNLREKFHPKKENFRAPYGFRHIKYTQVFSDRTGFTPNLSILDLLFNTGNQAYSILEDGTRPE